MVFLVDLMPVDIPVLVLCNKQDVEGAMSVEEITQELQLSSIQRPFLVVRGTSGITGEGIDEALDQLLQYWKLKSWFWT